MKFTRLIKLASAGYQDDALKSYVSRAGVVTNEAVGDTLALFIARELKDGFDESESDHDQIATAIGLLETARDDIGGIIEALSDEMQKIEEHDE